MSGYVHMDATYWGHNWGITLCIDDAIGKVLHLAFIKHEKTQSYVDAVEGVTAAGRSQGVESAGTAKGCSHPSEVVAATGR